MPSISYRALIRMGDGGLVITIPKAWARFYQLKPGERVEVIANDELTIRPLVGQDNGKTDNKRNQQARD